MTEMKEITKTEKNIFVEFRQSLHSLAEQGINVKLITIIDRNFVKLKNRMPSHAIARQSKNKISYRGPFGTVIIERGGEDV